MKSSFAYSILYQNVLQRQVLALLEREVRGLPAFPEPFW